MADFKVVADIKDGISPTLEQIDKGFKKTGEEAKKSLDWINERFQKVQTSSGTLKGKLNQLQQLMSKMNLEGLSGTEDFARIAAEAAAYKDAVSDAAAAVRLLSNDQAALQAGIQMFQGLSAAAVLVTSSMTLFGVENENVQKAMLKVQACIAALNALQTISNVLNKDSALMLQLKSIRLAANTAILRVNTQMQIAANSATVAADIHTKIYAASLAVLKAIMGDYKGLLILAAAGLVTWGIAAASSSKKADEHTEAIKKQTNAVDELKRNTAESIGEAAGKYETLRRSWTELRTEAEKTEWITANKTEIENLGLKVTDLNSAENVFVNKTSSVLAAFEARARKAGAMAAVIEKYKEWYKKLADIQSTAKGGGYAYTVKAGDDANKYKNWKEFSDWHEREYGVRAEKAEVLNGRNKFSEYGAARYNEWAVSVASEKQKANLKQGKDELQRSVKILFDEAAAADKELKKYDGLLTDTTRKPSRTQTAKPPEKTEEKVKLTPEMDDKSRKFAEDYLRQLQEDYKKLPVDISVENREKAQAELREWYQEAQKRKLILEFDPSITPGSVEEAEDVLSRLKSSLEDLDLDLISDEDIKQANEQIDKWEKELTNRKIRIGVEPIKPTIEESSGDIAGRGDKNDQRQSLDNFWSRIEGLRKDLGYGLIDKDEAERQIAELNEKLKSIGLEPIQLTVNADGTITTAQEEMEKLKDSVNTTLESVSSLGGSMNQLGGLIGGTTGKVIQMTGAIVQSAAQILPALAQIIGGSFAKAMAVGTAEAASLMFPANLPAIASIVAAVTSAAAAAMSLKNKFADGGVVQGTTFHGDSILASLNAGEMVLNKRQQAQLFRQLDSGANAPQPQVRWKIQGSDLVGAIENYNRKTSKYL